MRVCVLVAGGVLVGLTLGAGCAWQQDLDALAARVGELERDRQAVRAEMAEDVKRLETLHGMLEAAESTLRRSGANLGLRMERLEADVPKVSGELESVAVRLGAVAAMVDRTKRALLERLDVTALYLPADLPTEADAVWDLAGRRATQGRDNEARALFEHFAATWADDTRADDAHAWVAERFAAIGHTDKAISRLKRVVNDWPDGDQAAGATVRIAELLSELGRCEAALEVARYAAETYAGTSPATKAEALAGALNAQCGEPETSER